ncbi:MAG: hypothetical protein ACREEC_13350 [Thermoplasmata archaeon]
MTPAWTGESNGGLRIVWGSPDDFFQYLNGTVAPAALQFGYRLVVEPVPKAEVAVDRV